MLRALESLDAMHLEGQRALVRVDFNCPIAEGHVTDATRIRAALKTITYLRDHGARVVLVSHLGRPKGKVNQDFSLAPVRDTLEHLLGTPVTFIRDALGEQTVAASRRLPRGGIALLENIRFNAGEELNDAAFAATLALHGDFFVNDAFGAAHRAHASTEGVAHLLKPAVAGFLMMREVHFLGETLAKPKRPFVTILGGAKISGKIDLLDALLPKVDTILVGGAMACTFFRAMGLETGTSLVEEDRVDLARELLDRAGKKLILPKGGIVAAELLGGVTCQVASRDQIPAGFGVYDIDPQTVEIFGAHIGRAKTVLWNGPMGVFETPPFHLGTMGIAQAMAAATERGCVTIVGGGDSAAAVAAAGLEDRMTHVSTGGGASLEFLEGRPLPGLVALHQDQP